MSQKQYIEFTLHVTRMLWDVIGWRITSIGGPSGAVDKRCQIKCYFKFTNLLQTKKTQRESKHLSGFLKRSLTCFLSTDRELFARKATANLVVGVHANAVDTGRVQFYNVGLVVGG